MTRLGTVNVLLEDEIPQPMGTAVDNREGNDDESGKMLHTVSVVAVTKKH